MDMKNIKKREKWLKAVILILAFLMLLSIIPVFALCFYTYPCPGDDYAYATPLLKGLEQNGWSAIITAPVSFAAERYMNWQGSFLSCMMFDLNPMVFSLDYYGITMFLINLFFAFSVFYLSFTVFLRHYELKRYIAFFIGSLFLFAFYHCVPYVNLFEIVYWYTGAVFYLIPLACFLLFIAVLVRINERTEDGRKVRRKMIWAIILAVIIAFSNLTTAISTWSGLIIVTGLALIKKNPVKKQLLIILGVFTAVLLINVVSPGYMVRYDHGIDQGLITLETTNVFEVLLMSFKLGTQGLRSYAFIAPLIGVLLVISPVLVKQIKTGNGGFMNPLVLLAASYLVYIAQYAPFLYALGNVQYGRIIAYRFFLAQMFYAVNIINFAAYLASRKKSKRWVAAAVKTIILLGGIFLVCHSFMVRIIPSSHIRTMIDTWRDGTIPTYISEKEERIRLLEDDSIKEVAFEPMTETDVCFNFDYTSENPNDLLNTNLAEYYNKDFVIVKKED